MLTDQFEQHPTAAGGGAGSPRRGDPIQLRLASEPDSVPMARRVMVDIAGEHGADPEAVAIAVSEAVGNAIIHGYRGDSSGPVTIDARLEADALLIAVADEGVGMSPHPEWAGPGLGLPLIGRFSTSLDIERPPRGTRLVMRFALGG